MKTKAVRRGVSRILAFVLTVALVLSLLPALALAANTVDTGDLTVETPELLVTGKAVIGNNGAYSEANVGYEQAYTMEELKALQTVTHYYSTLNTSHYNRIYTSTGIELDTLLGGTAFNNTSAALTLAAADGYSKTLAVGELAGRYYYPNVFSASEEGKVEVPAMLNWASDFVTAGAPGTAGNDDGQLTSNIGQKNLEDMNNPYFVSGIAYVIGGDAITETALTVGSTEYTRGEILMMGRAARTYEYTSKKGDQTDAAIGVPLALLLADADADDVVTFGSADGYPVTASGMTVEDLIEKNYMLAYEVNDEAVYSTDKNDASIYGFFTLYGDGDKPAKMVNSITVADGLGTFGHKASGAPYDIDALTSATLTVEGPGVDATTPITVNELESTDDENIFRGSYTNGASKELIYEGVDVLSVLDGKVNNQVEKDDENIIIVFKNRWRQNIATVAYTDLKAASTAGKPVIISYGVSDGGSNTAPFVFDNATGYIAAIDNDDGPIRLVFDPANFTSTATSATVPAAFNSVAYIYVEEGAGKPGYKHSEATDDAYDNAANTEYLVTFTGTTLGREVNYTVAELEDMVSYNQDGSIDTNSLGHRDSYGLSNTTYWYVNEYEGVDLWKLMTTKLGINAETYKNDNATLVSFASWDNYQTTAKFSMAQLANPDLFYYYEKSPLDIGTNRPTKEQLATDAYQPTYSEEEADQWTTDANGYPVKKGYPVMLAYGVNGYPYVLNSDLDGYSGGLGNDGGPVKVIFGKADGMNRADESALENYAYFYNNGSNQLQRAQEIYIGDDARYSTHMENPAYADMADDTALTVELKTDAGTTTYTYTLAELESILYGDDVSKREMDTQGRQEKGYYAYKVKNDVLIEDLYEGVNLWYLLSEDIGLNSYLGDVELYSSESATTPEAVYTISEVQETGGNSARGTSDLGMMVAFAKNGYPMVATKNAEDGYVSEDAVTGKTIKNNGGPLMFVRGQTAAEITAGTVTTSGDKTIAVENLNKIVINLEADKYAHAGTDADNTVSFTGDVANVGAVKIGTLETKQKYMITDTYTIGSDSSEFRGLDLYKLLNDSSIGASALMESVTVKNAAGDEITLTVEDLMDPDKQIILAYGVTVGDAGTPLLPANGGYMRLVIDGGTAAECITNVIEISVKAAEIQGWTHSFGNYAQYATNTIEFSGAGLKESKTYTVAEIEAMTSIMVRNEYQMGGAYYIEGVDLYKLIQNIGFADGLTSANISVYANDGYAVQFTATDLKDGVNGKPMLLAYGQGTTATNGLPLVPNDTDAGYDANIANAFGPLRLVVNDNTGWCNKWVNKIVVGGAGSGGGSTEQEDPALTIKGYGDKDIICNVGGSGDVLIKKGITADNTTTDRTGKEVAAYSYTNKDVLYTDYVKGAYLIDLLEVAGIPVYADGANDITLTIQTTDGYSHETYENIPLSDIIDKDYFVAYDVATQEDMSDAAGVEDTDDNGKTATVRIYRNTGDTSNWRNRITNVCAITLGGSIPEGGGGGSTEQDDPALTIKGYGDKDIICNIGGSGDVLIKKGITAENTTSGRTGKEVAEYSFTRKDVLYTDYVKGAYLIDLLEVAGIPVYADGANDITLTIQTTDGYSDVTYENIPLSDIIDKDYFVAYDVAKNADMSDAAGVEDTDDNGKTATVRIYRNTGNTSNWKNRITNVCAITLKVNEQKNVYEAGVDLPLAGTRAIAQDAKDGIWVGSYGGGLSHIANDGTVTTYSTESTPALKSNYVSAVAVDAEGGIWFTQNGSYTDPSQNYGVGYMTDGTITWFDTTTANTLPDNYVQAIEIDAAGNVWFGSFGGLTKYDGTTWTTMDKDDGLVAASVTVIELDGNGGMWVGFYPDGAGTQSDLFKGGYAHINASGVVDFTKTYTGAYNETVGSSLLADVWVRDIAIDTDGTVWVVRSGSYGNMPTSVGGRIDKIVASGSTYSVTSSTGAELLGAALSTGSEVRALEADEAGGMWFGTSVDGAIYCDETGAVECTHSTSTGAWNESNTTLNNIYCLEFLGGDLYVGSAGGVAILSHPHHVWGEWEVIFPATCHTDGQQIHTCIYCGVVETEDLPKGADNCMAEAFKDIDTNRWYHEGVEFAILTGLMNGMSADTFAPMGTMTRGQLVTILYRLAGEPTGSAKSGFVDVASGRFYTKAVDWAYANGIVNGMTATEFQPDGNVTREQMVVILMRFAKHVEIDTSARADLSGYTDSSAVRKYAKNAMSWAVAEGLIKGVTKTTLEPASEINRASVATLMMRFCTEILLSEE